MNVCVHACILACVLVSVCVCVCVLRVCMCTCVCVCVVCGVYVHGHIVYRAGDSNIWASNDLGSTEGEK